MTVTTGVTASTIKETLPGEGRGCVLKYDPSASKCYCAVLLSKS